MATLDDSAASLNIGEKHCLQLLLDGKLVGWQRTGQYIARHFRGLMGRPPAHVMLRDCPAEVRKAAIGAYVVHGPSVRARMRSLKGLRT